MKAGSSAPPTASPRPVEPARHPPVKQRVESSFVPVRAGRQGEREETCVVLGPSNAGKTCTLVAFGASCYVDSKEADVELTVFNDPTVDNNDLLNRYAMRWIALDDPPPATEERRNYKVEISMRVGGHIFRPARGFLKTLRCSDGRGGNLFYSDEDRHRGLVDPQSERGLLDQAAEATTLILVVDATNPATVLFEQSLSRILDHIARPRESEDIGQPSGVRLLEWLGLRRRDIGGRRSRIGASRVLILLTKIDALAHAISTQLRAVGVRESPLRIANLLDPVALALDLLGERSLRRIRRAMGVHAELAVGLASATGFHRESGETFLEWSRTRKSLGKPEQDAARRLRAWSPYGLREALIFITTGGCSGPLLRVDRKDRLSLDGALPVDSYPLGSKYQ